jgi:ferredoxin
MSEYNITFKMPNGEEENISCNQDEYILDAAEKSGIEIPYSCRSGVCSSCIGKVIDGDVNNVEQIFLNDEQLDSDFVLLCCAYPESDCIIEVNAEENF